MPNYLIQPQADHTADPTDLSNAIWALGVSDPGTVSGLTNGTAYVAREFVLSPASAAFTSQAAGAPNLFETEVWTEPTGVAVSGGVLTINSPGQYDVTSQTPGNYIALPGTDSDTYQFDLTLVSNSGLATDRLRIALTCFDGADGTLIGAANPERIGGSTVELQNVNATYPATFTVPAGSTHMRIGITVMDPSMSCALSDLTITAV